MQDRTKESHACIILEFNDIKKHDKKQLQTIDFRGDVRVNKR